MVVEFPTVPPVGTILMLDDQRYELTVVQDYTRKDGNPSKLLTWLAGCADCGGEFEQLTGLKSKELTRRCKAHRKPNVTVGKRGHPVRVTIIDPTLCPIE